MIIISLHCQMGNQMFQYSMARATAKKLHTRFLPFCSNPFYPFKLEYFKLDWFTTFVYSHPKVMKQYHRVCRKLVKYVYKEEIGDNEGMGKVESLRNKAYYKGFFQSDSYFSDIEDEIRRAFIIKDEYQKSFHEKYDELFSNNKTIVVHVRRTDYQEVEFESMGGKGVALPKDYYLKTLSMIPNMYDYKILFVSDDIESVKKDFADITNAQFESNSQIVDFQLIQHADIAIISNSTFAWWAAYLSPKVDHRVLSPKYWLGFKVEKTFPIGIETPRFEWIEI